MSESMYIQHDPNHIPDIITFAEASWGLKLVLRPVQKFILKMFYGMALDDTVKSIQFYEDPIKKTGLLSLTERGYYPYLAKHGRVRTTVGPNQEATQLVLAAGRRSSKSFLANVITLYEAYRHVGYPPAGRDPEKVQMVRVMTSRGQCEPQHKDLVNQIEGVPALALHRPRTTGTKTTLSQIGNPADTLLSIVSQGPVPLERAWPNKLVVLDEHAFLPPTYWDIPDVSKVRKTDRKFVSLSTPHGDNNEFSTLWHDTHPGRLSLQIPTWEMIPEVDLTRQYEDGMKGFDKTDTWFRIEWGAEFLPVPQAPVAEGPVKPLSLRMPPALQARMDIVDRVIRERTCGVEMDTSKILFRVMDRGLEAMERDLGIVRDPATPRKP